MRMLKRISVLFFQKTLILMALVSFLHASTVGLAMGPSSSQDSGEQFSRHRSHPLNSEDQTQLSNLNRLSAEIHSFKDCLATLRESLAFFEVLERSNKDLSYVRALVCSTAEKTKLYVATLRDRYRINPTTGQYYAHALKSNPTCDQLNPGMITNIRKWMDAIEPLYYHFTSGQPAQVFTLPDQNLPIQEASLSNPTTADLSNQVASDSLAEIQAFTDRRRNMRQSSIDLAKQVAPIFSMGNNAGVTPLRISRHLSLETATQNSLVSMQRAQSAEAVVPEYSDILVLDNPSEGDILRFSGEMLTGTPFCFSSHSNLPPSEKLRKPRRKDRKRTRDESKKEKVSEQQPHIPGSAAVFVEDHSLSELNETKSRESLEIPRALKEAQTLQLQTIRPIKKRARSSEGVFGPDFSRLEISVPDSVPVIDPDQSGMEILQALSKTTGYPKKGVVTQLDSYIKTQQGVETYALYGLLRHAGPLDHSSLPHKARCCIWLRIAEHSSVQERRSIIEHLTFDDFIDAQVRDRNLFERFSITPDDSSQRRRSHPFRDGSTRESPSPVQKKRSSRIVQLKNTVPVSSVRSDSQFIKESTQAQPIVLPEEGVRLLRELTIELFECCEEYPDQFLLRKLDTALSYFKPDQMKILLRGLISFLRGSSRHASQRRLAAIENTIHAIDPSLLEKEPNWKMPSLVGLGLNANEILHSCGIK